VVLETQLDPMEIKQLLAKGTTERDRIDIERVRPSTPLCPILLVPSSCR
jgi:hypothetical protein